MRPPRDHDQHERAAGKPAQPGREIHPWTTFIPWRCIHWLRCERRCVLQLMAAALRAEICVTHGRVGFNYAAVGARGAVLAMERGRVMVTTV